MPVLTAADIDTASVITNLMFAGGAVLGVQLIGYGYRKILGFFGR
jgi:hypothetical protein